MTTHLEATSLRDRLLNGLPVTDRRMTVAGVRTAVLEGGDGPPVVLLHGPHSTGAHWAPVLADLAATHRVIAPDLPGQGATEPLDPGAVLDWLAELIEHTCPEPPSLVGVTLGGAVAARFAAAHGDRIGRLVLVDAFGLVPLSPEPAFGSALQRFLAEPTENTQEQLWRECVHDFDDLGARLGERRDPFLALSLESARTPVTQGGFGSLMEHFGMPGADDLDRIAVPTTLIWGRSDPVTPLAVGQEHAARRGWPLIVIDDAGDDPPAEQPEAFLRALRLRVLAPGRPGFAEATRLWNGLIAKQPAHVVQPAGTDDVVAAVALARDLGLPLTVRGGGHHIAGLALADGAVTIDMAGLRDVVVDAEARTATVQPGCLLADVDRATQQHGLATPLGFISEVGVAGLTLGGGLGYLTRRFGWTVDNLLEVEIVTADGTVRRVSRDEQADLFWGVRGAGAALGVVTSFTFRLHEIGPTIYGGLIAWPFERAPEILDAYRQLTAAAPRELAVWMNMLRAPAAPFVPVEWQGERVCVMSVCFSGDLAEADEALAPLRALGDPVFDLLGERPYVEQQSFLDATEPKGDHYYWKAGYLPDLDDDFLAIWRELAAACPIPRAQVGLLHLGGALNEHAAGDGVVGNRDAQFACGLIGIWGAEGPDSEYERWVREAWERVAPFSAGAYVNFQTADEGEDRLRAAYGANFDRLVELKRVYDPEGMFRSIRSS
jgi:FAD/FMN-containing dehydrogenase/pimeloyl-ACP methyl ester carboxylesterase